AGRSHKKIAAPVGVANAGQLSSADIGQSTTVAVDDTGNESLRLAAADADDAVIGGKAIVADINVVTAGGDAGACGKAQCDVVRAAPVIDKRKVANGRVVGAVRISQERTIAVGCVEGTARVKGERTSAIGRVAGAARVNAERSAAIGRVVGTAGCVVAG